MTRLTTASIGIALMYFIIMADYLQSRPNPYQQPAIIALGSGSASAGGFCGALPD